MKPLQSHKKGCGITIMSIVLKNQVEASERSADALEPMIAHRQAMVCHDVEALMHQIVEAGSEPGLLAYRDGNPVGWISVAPRPQYGRILRSRRIGPKPDEADDERVWSIVCFWIPRAERGKGVANELLKGAIEHAKERGARHLEAYPVDTASGRQPAANLFTGTLAMFERAGFHEVDRPRGAQLVMRRGL